MINPELDIGVSHEMVIIFVSGRDSFGAVAREPCEGVEEVLAIISEEDAAAATESVGSGAVVVNKHTGDV